MKETTEGSPITVDGLTGETEYEVFVSAVDDRGLESAASDSVTFTTERIYFDWSDGWTPSPPHDYNMADGGSMSSAIVDVSYSSNPTLELDQGGADGGFKGVTKSFDLTDAVELTIDTYFDRDGQYDQMVIKVGGDDLYKSDAGHGWTERSFDVSGYSGTTDLQFGHNTSGNNYRYVLSRWTNAKLNTE